jgi:hypothetical protein
VERVLELLDHGPDLVPGREFGDIVGGGAALRRFKRVPEVRHVVPVELRYQVAGLTVASCRRVATDRVAAEPR